MAVALNSVVGFNSSAKYKVVRRTDVRASMFTANFAPSTQAVGLSRPLKSDKWGSHRLVANGDSVVTDTTTNNSKNVGAPNPVDSSSEVNRPSVDSPEIDRKIPFVAEAGSAPQASVVANGSVANPKEGEVSSNNPKSTSKRSPLTAREKLRAARVLSRYNEPKASKPELGSKLLEVLRESEKGKKRSGLPEAPTNLFDDSKRGMPKPGWTFEFPGGFDVFLIIFSFVFISTVMFATTYIVWKVGAIHFNEY